MSEAIQVVQHQNLFNNKSHRQFQRQVNRIVEKAIIESELNDLQHDKENIISLLVNIGKGYQSLAHSSLNFELQLLIIAARRNILPFSLINFYEKLFRCCQSQCQQLSFNGKGIALAYFKLIKISRYIDIIEFNTTINNIIMEVQNFLAIKAVEAHINAENNFQRQQQILRQINLISHIHPQYSLQLQTQFYLKGIMLIQQIKIHFQKTVIMYNELKSLLNEFNQTMKAWVRMYPRDQAISQIWSDLSNQLHTLIIIDCDIQWQSLEYRNLRTIISCFSEELISKLNLTHHKNQISRIRFLSGSQVQEYINPDQCRSLIDNYWIPFQRRENNLIEKSYSIQYFFRESHYFPGTLQERRQFQQTCIHLSNFNDVSKFLSQSLDEFSYELKSIKLCQQVTKKIKASFETWIEQFYEIMKRDALDSMQSQKLSQIYLFVVDWLIEHKLCFIPQKYSVRDIRNSIIQRLKLQQYKRQTIHHEEQTRVQINSMQVYFDYALKRQVDHLNTKINQIQQIFNERPIFEVGNIRQEMLREYQSQGNQQFLSQFNQMTEELNHEEQEQEWELESLDYHDGRQIGRNNRSKIVQIIDMNISERMRI